MLVSEELLSQVTGLTDFLKEFLLLDESNEIITRRMKFLVCIIQSEFITQLLEVSLGTEFNVQ